MCEASYCYWCELFFAAGDICAECLRCVECCRFSGCHQLSTTGASAWPPVTKTDLRTDLADRGGLPQGVADTILLTIHRRAACGILNLLAVLLLDMGRSRKESLRLHRKFRHLVGRLCRVEQELASLETRNEWHHAGTNVLPRTPILSPDRLDRWTSLP